jgi:integrase
MKPFRTYLWKKKHRSGNITWCVRWKDPKHGRWVSIAGGRDQTEASLIEARVREALLKGEDPRPQQHFQKEYHVADLIDLFYESARFQASTPKWQFVTRRQYESMVRPYFGSCYFTALKKDQIYKAYLDLKAKGYSHSTILKYHNKLSLLGQLHEELVPTAPNPIRLIRDFRRFFPKQPPTRSIDFLTPGELERLFEGLKHCRSNLILPFIKFLANTGLRRGEAQALKWVDIDFESGFIYIRKSKNGRMRRVPLEKASLDALAMLQRTSEYVFSSKDGKCFHSDSFLKPLKTAAKKVGIEKRVDLHAMRHSYASNKIRSGWGIRKVSQILGHSDITLTSEVYSHLLDGDLKVQDEFLFDKEKTSANIESLGEQKDAVEKIVEQLTDVLNGLSINALQQPEFASKIQSAIRNEISSSGMFPLASTLSEKNGVFVPLMIRKGQNGAWDRIPVPSQSANLSNDIQEMKWRTRVESNHRPSASEADTLSN